MQWLHMTEWSVAPFIFNRDIKYIDKLFSAYPSHFLVEKKPVPLNTRRSTLQNICNQFGEQKNLFPLQTVEPHLLDRPARNLLSIVRSWLSFMSE